MATPRLLAVLLGASVGLSGLHPDALAQSFYPLNSPANSSLTAVVYGTNRWVAVGRQNTILLSLDGLRWTQVHPGFGSVDDFFSVAYGNGLFIAGGSGGSLLCSSADGTNWSRRLTTTSTQTIRGLAFGAGKFVAVGSVSGAAYLTTSSDGINWTFPTLPAAPALNAIMYDSQWRPLFVAVGDAGTILTSSNGVSWTAHSSGTSANLRAVSMGTNGRYVTAGDAGLVLISIDGQSWSPGAPTSFTVRALSSTYSSVVAVGDFDTEGRIQATSDAQFWPGNAGQYSSPLNGISAAAYWAPPFIAVGENGLLLTSFAGTAPLVNSWTKPVSGSWEELFWSLGELPLFWNQQVLFTNAGSKSLTVGASTVFTHPDSLKLRDLVVNAPPGAQNLLVLNGAGLATPLDIANQLLIGTNGSLLSVGSAVKASALEVDRQAVFDGPGQSQFGTVLVHNPGLAQIVLSNGSFTAGTLTVGVDHWQIGDSPAQGAFTQYGGSNELGNMVITESSTFSLVGGHLHLTNGIGLLDMSVGHFPGSARLSVSGGDLSATGLYLRGNQVAVNLSGGTIAAGSVEIWQGGFEQTAGVGLLNSLVVIGPSLYHLADGVLISGSAHVSVGSFSQQGGVHTNTGSVEIVGMDPSNPSTYTFSGGILETPLLSVQGGRFFEQAGTTNHSTQLKVWSGGVFNFAGGALSTSNTVVGDPSWPGGLFTQTGGTHTSGRLDLFASGTYDFQAGVLSVETITVATGAELRFTNNGTLQSNQSIVLNGGTLTPAATRQFGVLQVTGASPAFFNFHTGSPTILRFADSHNASWDTAQIQIRNWNSPAHHLFAGSNGQGLTSVQLNQIVFLSPAGLSGNYPAQMLPTGEIVPAIAGALLCTPTNNGLMISWSTGLGLYSSTNLSGPYEFLTFSTPYFAPFTDPQRFFVVH